MKSKKQSIFIKNFIFAIDAVMKTVSVLGNIISLGFIFIFLLFIKQFIFALEFAAVIAVVMIICYLIKILFKTKRPDYREKKDLTIFEKIDLSSFPSVHAARMTSLPVIVYLFFNDALLAIFLLILLIFVIFSRLYLKRHYFRDIIGGILIGVVVSVIVHFVFFAV